MDSIIKRLFELQDVKYRDFNASLTPTLDRNTVIGVRTPLLRALAKELSGSKEAAVFLKELPHQYFDENQLHAFLLEKVKDFDACIDMVNAFLPYVDNWATCDQLNPKVFAKHKDELLEYIDEWLNSGETYKIRYGIRMYMCHFLDADFDVKYARRVAGILSDEYYINMMIAWYFATALAKQYDAIIPFIENRVLPEWVHKKTIQKAVESYRITDEQKVYLKSLR